MAKCEYCGEEIPQWCDGIQYWGPDPYQEEINDDHKDYWECDGERAASALDI